MRLLLVKGSFDSAINRSTLFIVTKLNPCYLGYESTLDAIQLSLGNLHTDYLDAFLIHSIGCDNEDEPCLPCGHGEPSGSWKDSWRAMEKLHFSGVIRSLGISNVDIPLLEELVEFAKVPVSLVQNWFDPFNQDEDVRIFCKQYAIAYMGYSTLGSVWIGSGIVDYNPVLDNNELRDIATNYKASVSQIVLRWAMDSDVIVIPRSSQAVHINVNFMSTNIALHDFEMETVNRLEGRIRMPDEDVVDYELNANDQLGPFSGNKESEHGCYRLEDDDTCVHKQVETGIQLCFCRQLRAFCMLLKQRQDFFVGLSALVMLDPQWCLAVTGEYCILALATATSTLYQRKMEVPSGDSM